MRNLTLFTVFVLICASSYGANRYWVAGAASNWNNTTNWSTASGGAGGASVPVAGDFVFFDANGLGNCNLDVAAAFDGISVSGYTGIIDLAGFAFDASVGGASNCTFASGTINDGPATSSVSHTTTGLTRFSGTVFGAIVNISANQVDFDGGTFNASVTCTATGAGSINGAGGCTFNSTFQVTNSGTGYFLMAQASPDVFNSTVTLINSSTSRIRMAYSSAGNAFNGNVIVENSGGGVWFGEGGGTSTLAAGNTLTVGAGGFTSSDLRIFNLTQLGATAQMITATGTARVYFSGSTFNGTVDVDSPQIIITSSTFNTTTDFQKNGAGSNSSGGGNNFVGNAIFGNSGSGYFLLGNGSPDVFGGNVTFNNTGTHSMYLGYNSAGNTLAGNLTINNTTTGTGGHTYISGLAGSTVAITGNTTITHNSTGTNCYVYFPNAGDITLTGTLDYTNSSTGTTCNSYFGAGGDLTVTGDATFVNSGSATTTQTIIANTAASLVTFNGLLDLDNSASGTTGRIYLGLNGDVNINGAATLSNAGASTNSQIYVAYNSASVATFAENIVLESTVATSDGILFGPGGGTSSLAATKTVTIGAGGFSSGSLYFRNFTQTGGTAQTLLGTGTTYFQNYDSNWGGDVDFRAIRMNTRGTMYSGTAYLEKTGGIGNDGSVGGNTFVGDASLVNTGSNYLLMGNGSPDTFGGDLTLLNSGSHSIYLAYNSAGNTVAGNLVGTHSGTGAGATYLNLSGLAASTLAITGTVTLTNSSSSGDARVYLGNAGDVTLGSTLTMNHTASGTVSRSYIASGATSTVIIPGDVVTTQSGSSATSLFYTGNSGIVTIGGNWTIVNSGTGNSCQFYAANQTTSTVTVAGNTTLTNSGALTTKRTYLGLNGDMTFNGTLAISNSSSATNSGVYCNHNVSAVNLFNENVTVEVTDASCDGIYFGNGNGAATLAATKTITVGAGGYIAGYLWLRNFTQVGATPHTLLGTGTAHFYIYDSSWGDDVDFRAPRMHTRGTSYAGTTYLEKTGGIGTDDWQGGNTFTGNSEIVNSGSFRIMTGNGSPDTWGGNLIFTNSGTNHMYLAQNSAGNTIAGNLTVSNIATGTYSIIAVSNAAASTVTVAGDAVFNNSGSTADARLYIGNSGALTLSGTSTLVQDASGAQALTYFGNAATANITIGSDASFSNIAAGGTNHQMYICENPVVAFGGDLTINNTSAATNASVRMSQGAASSATITGNTILTNGGAGTTHRLSIGGNGDVTFNGTVDITNNSPATNSQVYMNRSAGSLGTYNENITIASTTATTDGIYFGDNNGSATLAATKTVTIGAGGYIAGEAWFRNFTQVGATAQTLLATGTARIYNYDSNWGGDIDFRAPRMHTRGTTYNLTSYLEKTGASDDNSQGGNTFVGNAQLVNSGSGQFLMGNGSPDDFQSDLDVTNSGTDHFYLAYNAAGNTIDGDFTINHTVTGTYGIISISNQTASTLTVGGTTTYNLSAATADSRFYLGNNGDITFNDDVTISYIPTGAATYGYIGTGTSSDIIINGDLSVLNTSAGTTRRMYIGNNGTVTVTGNVTLTNSSTANDSRFYLGTSAVSSVTINGNTTISNSGAATTKQFYIGEQGDCTFNGTLAIANSASATNSQIYLNRIAASSNAYNGNVTVECTNASCDGILFGNNGGFGTLAAGQTISISGGGFIAGYLYFRNFTQLGATAQSLMPTAASRLENYASTWNGDVDFRAPRHFTRTTTYNGTTLLEKNGASNDASVGGNIFNGSTTLRVTGTGYFMPANGTGNDFNNDVSYVKTGAGLIYPTYNTTSTYAGDITVDAATQVTFGAAANGRVQMDGSAAQSFNIAVGTPDVRMRDLQTSNTVDEITLNAPLNVISVLDLDDGNILTTTTNLLYMNDNAIVSSASNDAFVDGPIDKIGNDSFTFPVGDGNFYRPIQISAPTSTAARFRGQYLEVDPHPSYDHYSVDATINHISSCEHWLLDRIATTNNVSVTLSWDAGTSCGVTLLADLIVARWDGAVWRDEGNSATTGTVGAGTVTSLAPITSFSPFTLASISFQNPLPVELIDFDVEKIEEEALISWSTLSEINNDYFEVQRSTNGINFNTIGKVDGAINSSERIDYSLIDTNPYQGVNYYRLKQIDLDGSYEYSEVRTVEFDFGHLFSVYPNPVNDDNQLTVVKTMNDNYDSFQMTDLTGRKVRISPNEVSDFETSVDLSQLENGVYFLLLKVGNKEVVKRVVAQ